MAQNVTLWGASYSNVPAINVPKTGGGTARFTDTSGTTAVAADVASGKIFYDSSGAQQTGTNSGGGGSEVQVESGLVGIRSSASSISFAGLKGQPIAFYAILDNAVDTSSTANVVAFVYDGQTLHAQTINTQVTYNDASLSYAYNNGTLTITSGGDVSFPAGEFYLTYAYNGSASNIDTKDVQVGSGATSITFTGLDDEPIAWSCIFKSNFSTSSGYQRVVYVDYEDGTAYGIEMDSRAHNALHWTASYNNGSLTITSNGTNQGGYFHQPGYYQLTAIYGEPSPYQAKTVTPTTSQQVVEPDSDYEALSRVTVNPIPSEYIIPTGNYVITQNGNNINVAQYATVSVNVSGGGSTKNIQVNSDAASVRTNGYTATSITLTVAKTGTYTVSWTAWRSSSSGTMGTNLHRNNTTGTNQQTWTNTYGQHIVLNNQSYTAGDVLTLYATAGSTSRYCWVSNLIIEEV